MKNILFLILVSLFLPTTLFASEPCATATTGTEGSVPHKVELKSSPSATARVEVPVTNKVKFKNSAFTTTSSTHGVNHGSTIKWIKVLNNYADLIGAAASLSAVLAALYLGSWRDIRRKPRIKLFFNENKSYPYFHKLSFGSFDKSIDFEGHKIDILIPGFNARIKVANKGKSTARNVQARIEKIEFKKHNEISAPTTYYHPTKVKWSGESTWNPIDIVPQSHFFLDIFHAINLTSDEIAAFNEQELKKQKIDLDFDLLKDIVKEDVKPDEEAYWNVWVDSPHSRGVPSRYYFQGDIIIYFVINSENCDPLKFEALIAWTLKDWNDPNIKIRIANDYINNDG